MSFSCLSLLAGVLPHIRNRLTSPCRLHLQTVKTGPDVAQLLLVLRFCFLETLNGLVLNETRIRKSRTIDLEQSINHTLLRDGIRFQSSLYAPCTLFRDRLPAIGKESFSGSFAMHWHDRGILVILSLRCVLFCPLAAFWPFLIRPAFPANE